VLYVPSATIEQDVDRVLGYAKAEGYTVSMRRIIDTPAEHKPALAAS